MQVNVNWLIDTVVTSVNIVKSTVTECQLLLYREQHEYCRMKIPVDRKMFPIDCLLRAQSGMMTPLGLKVTVFCVISMFTCVILDLNNFRR